MRFTSLRLRTLAAACAALNVALFTPTAAAQIYPSKPVRLVVPYPAGGSGIDLVSRLVAARMGETLGQPMLVDNRPGGNGMIGSEAVARAAPDGYMLVFGTPSTHVLVSLLQKSAPYDPFRDFTPIVTLTDVLMCLVVHPSVPAANVKDLVEYVKRYPGKLNFGSNGMGSTFHFATELFSIAAGGLSMVHVPYKGNALVLPALVSGEVQLAFSGVPAALGHVKSGKVRALAVLEPSRYAGMPDVPSIQDTLPGFRKPAGWYMVLGPAGLPAPVLQRLNADFVNAVEHPEVRAKLEPAGLSAVGNSPGQSAALMRQSFEVYSAAVKAAGIRPE